MRLLLVLLVLVLWSVQLVYAQTGSNTNSSISVTLEVSVPSPLRPGSQGAIVARIKNILVPREPIQLQATATYELNGQTVTVSSNVVTLQVIQPIDIKSLNLRLPSYIVLGGGVKLPISLNVTLLEGQEHVVNVPITVN